MKDVTVLNSLHLDPMKFRYWRKAAIGYLEQLHRLSSAFRQETAIDRCARVGHFRPKADISCLTTWTHPNGFV